MIGFVSFFFLSPVLYAYVSISKDDKRTDAKYRSDIESLVTKAISLSPTDKNGQLWTFAALFYNIDPKDMHTNPYVSSLARELVDEIRTPQSQI